MNLTSQEETSDVLELAHVDPRPLRAGTAFERPVGEEPVVDDVVVHLRNHGGKVVVLPHEGHQLRRRPVDGEESRVDLEVLDHEVEEPPATTGSLAGFVHVEVQDAHRINLVLIPVPGKET